MVAERRLRPSLPGVVRRPSLVKGMAKAGPLVTVAAPAGYGKSSLLAEWLENEPRPAAWLTLDRADNDPVEFLCSLAVALDAVEPIEPNVVDTLGGPAPAVTTVALPRFACMLASRSTPFVLALDDVHLLETRAALDVLAVVVSELPAHATIAMAGRWMPDLRFGRLRAKRPMLELGPEHLAMSTAEAEALFRSLDLRLGAHQVDQLVDRTEGWPVALYLAGLSVLRQPDTTTAVASFAGTDRFVADYLRDELLRDLDPDEASFLLEASCLPKLSGPACDAILGRRGSAELLARLADQNLLVIPLDHQQEWYRLHHLLAELLHRELHHRDRDHCRELHRRASEWAEGEGDADVAVHEAMAANDLDRAEELACQGWPQLAAHGRFGTIRSWVALFPPEEISRRPRLTIITAYTRLQVGDGAGATRWLRQAEAAVSDPYAPEVRGWTSSVALAILRMTIASQPARATIDDAEYAGARVNHAAWEAMCALTRGGAELLLGDTGRAEEALDEAFAGASPGTPNLAALAMALRSAVRVEQGNWREATEAALEGRAILERFGLLDVPNLYLVTAHSSMVEARGGRPAEAEVDRRRALRHFSGCARIAPWAGIPTCLALARAGLALGDRAGARGALGAAEVLLGSVPDAMYAKEQAADLSRLLDEVPAGASWGPESLTAAELRVLQYLPTHLTIAEIAEHLYVSRNTAKTHAIAIYRKLGTSSRRGAVDVARRAGLLDPLADI